MITFASYFGGVGGGTGESIAVDPQGYVYITGVANSTTLPVKDAMQEFFAGSNDIFVAKFDPNGGLVFSTYIGSWGDERAFDIAVDPQGNSYVTGFTTAEEFPVTPGVVQPNYGGGSVVNGGDGFLLKLSAAGDRVVYATYFGGSKDEIVRSVAVDSTGAAYMLGETLSEDLPVKNAFQEYLKPSPEGNTTIPRDVFVAKFSPDGSELVYSTYIGSSALDEAWAIAVDSQHHAWIAATTRVVPGSSPAVHDWPLVNQTQTNFGGSTRDVVAVKMSADGSSLLYSTLRGGNGDDVPRAITIDHEDNVYITGFSGNANYPRTSGTTRLGIAGNREVIITKFANDGRVVASALYGGQMLDDGFGIAVDKDQNVYVVGYTQAKNFPLVNELQKELGSPCKDNLTNCTADWFLAKFNPELTQLLFSTYLGGNATDQTRAAAIDPRGRLWVVGNTQSGNQPLVNPVEGKDRYRGGGPAVAYLLSVDVPE